MNAELKLDHPIEGKRVNFVLVTFNSAPHIEKCIDSLLRVQSKHLVDIVVVDNGSKDQTLELLAQYGEKIKVIANGKNLGYGKANNIGCFSHKADFYFIFNVDAYIEDNFSLDKVVDRCVENEERYAIMGTRLQYPDKSTQTSSFSHSSALKWAMLLAGANYVVKAGIAKSRFVKGLFSYSEICRSYLDNHQAVVNDYSVETVGWISGAAMIVSQSYIEKYGLFDENIFLYGEDEDLCIMAKSRGYLVGVINSDPVTHVHGWGTVNRFNKVVADLKYGSLQYFIDKNFSNTLMKKWMMKALLPFHVYGIAGGVKALFTKQDIQAVSASDAQNKGNTIYDYQ
ncbi:glycosyltransferase family 2 protein [Vibrio sp. RC27]